MVLTYVQPGGSTGAKEELIVMHNNSAVEVDITNWCVMNKSSVLFACFTVQASSEGEVHLIVPPYQSATIASFEYVAAHGGSGAAFSLVYSVTNQSSGSIVGSSDTISLVNADREVLDTFGWQATFSSSKAWSRVKLLSAPDIYGVGNDTNDWTLASLANYPTSGLEMRIVKPEAGSGDTETDTPPSDESESSGGGEGSELGASGETDTLPDSPSPPLPSPIVINELLANAAGTDTGNEFIELHNTDTAAAHSLQGLRLRIGLDSAKWYTLPDVTVPADGYISFKDSELGFTLVNTDGGVQLYSGDTAIGDLIEYSSPKDDQAWALIDEVWQYTNIPTPGAANSAMTIATDDSTDMVPSVQKPCASNQFRNPDTGRCKLIAAAVKAPTPCKADQTRNPATGRCKNSTSTNAPTPCKEGQERNPETNRCRTIVKMATADFGVKGVQTKASAQLSWYYWAAIIGVILVVLGYAIWEWRTELVGLWKRLIAPFARE
jgi:hypothetical protein